MNPDFEISCRLCCFARAVTLVSGLSLSRFVSERQGSQVLVVHDWSSSVISWCLFGNRTEQLCEATHDVAAAALGGKVLLGHDIWATLCHYSLSVRRIRQRANALFAAAHTLPVHAQYLRNYPEALDTTLSSLFHRPASPGRIPLSSRPARGRKKYLGRLVFDKLSSARISWLQLISFFLPIPALNK